MDKGNPNQIFDYNLTQTLKEYKNFRTVTLNGEEHSNYEDALKELNDIRKDISKNDHWSEITTSDGEKYTYCYHDPVLDDNLTITYHIEKKEHK